MNKKYFHIFNHWYYYLCKSSENENTMLLVTEVEKSKES